MSSSSLPQFCLGHADWGVLMWPLELFDSDCEGEYYILKAADSEVKWEFLHDPLDWKVVEMEPVWHSDIICLQCNQPWEICWMSC